MDDGRGVSVYGYLIEFTLMYLIDFKRFDRFNSRFIVGHLFSGPVLIWDLEKALANPEAASSSLLLAEFPVRVDVY